MKEVLDLLLSNLKDQQAAMVKDDIAQVLELIGQQEALVVKLHEFLGGKPELTEADRRKVREVAELVETNQLLAQQSLAFSRKMLRQLGNEESYGEDGAIAPSRMKSQRVDLRA